MVKMLHQGVAGAFSWSTCCSQWLNHCVKVISTSVVFLLSCFSVLQVMALFRSVELRPGDRLKFALSCFVFCHLLVTLHNGIAALKGP